MVIELKKKKKYLHLNESFNHTESYELRQIKPPPSELQMGLNSITDYSETLSLSHKNAFLISNSCSRKCYRSHSLLTSEFIKIFVPSVLQFWGLICTAVSKVTLIKMHHFSAKPPPLLSQYIMCIVWFPYTAARNSNSYILDAALQSLYFSALRS